MSNDNIQVAIVEDDREIRQLMTLLIDSSPGYTCKQSFNDCESALQTILADPPDVVLMDIDLPGMSGIEGVRRLKESLPSTEFIMLTVQEDDESVFESICAGAVGYLLKETPPAELLEAIRDVCHGAAPMSASIARRVVVSFRRGQTSPLSSRETEVLEYLCEGENYRAIAQALGISGDTVRAHIKNIYEKLQVHSRAEVVKKAIKDRLI